MRRAYTNREYGAIGRLRPVRAVVVLVVVLAFQVPVLQTRVEMSPCDHAGILNQALGVHAVCATFGVTSRGSDQVSFWPSFMSSVVEAHGGVVPRQRLASGAHEPQAPSARSGLLLRSQLLL